MSKYNRATTDLNLRGAWGKAEPCTRDCDCSTSWDKCLPACYVLRGTIGGEDLSSHRDFSCVGGTQSNGAASDDDCTRGRHKGDFSTLYFDWWRSWSKSMTRDNVFRSSILGDLLRAHSDWQNSRNKAPIGSTNW